MRRHCEHGSKGRHVGAKLQMAWFTVGTTGGRGVSFCIRDGPRFAGHTAVPSRTLLQSATQSLLLGACLLEKMWC